MHIDINPVDYMTAEQKAEIGSLVFEKIKKSILSVKVSGQSLNISKILRDDLIYATEEGGGIFSPQSSMKIGDAIADVMADSIKKTFSSKG